MAKKIMSDMIVEKKSIRQIPIARDKKIVRKTEVTDIEESPKVRRNSNWRRKPPNPKFVIWLMAGICLLALFFGISLIFSSATVIIKPRTANVSFVDEIYTAKADSAGSSDLLFETIQITESAGEVVAATEEEDVTQKASGKIIIYNNYSTASQRLINNTRFESSTGKIYRISSSVVVPGTTKKDGSIIPGSVEVTVYADQAGEDYNLMVSDLTGDFKIPGFKGDPRYAGFYARIKTDIIGGIVGKQRVVAADVRDRAEEAIKARLREQLLKELYAVKPENYLVFEEGYSIVYRNTADTPVDKDKVKINIEGTLSSVVFNNAKLSKQIASSKIKDFDGLLTEFIPGDDFVVTFDVDKETNYSSIKSLKIILNGSAIIKWSYDVDAIKKDLAGRKEADVKSLVLKYKDSIVGFQILFRPVWTRYVPDNLDRIKIVEDTK